MNIQLTTYLAISLGIHALLLYPSSHQVFPNIRLLPALPSISVRLLAPAISSASQSLPAPADMKKPPPRLHKREQQEEVGQHHMAATSLAIPPKLRIGPELTIPLDDDDDRQSCRILIEVTPKGRASNVTILNHTGLSEGILNRITDAFKNESVFIPSTINGIPVPGKVVLEVDLYNR